MSELFAGQDVLQRAVLWTLMGAATGHRGAGLLGWGLGGLLAERALGFRLDVELLRWARQQTEEAVRRRQLEEVRRNFLQAVPACPQVKPDLSDAGREVLPNNPSASHTPTQVVLPHLSLPTKLSPEPDLVWRKKILTHPTVILIVGKRGSGKSALGYRLLELCRYVAPPHVVGVPEFASPLFPDWVGIAPTIEDVPANAVVLVDEAHLRYHARSSMTSVTKAMSEILSLARQRAQTWIFVAPEARQIDRNIVSAANVLIFKDLGMLQPAFERPELRHLVGQAKNALATVQGDRRKWAFVHAPETDFLGLLENELPSFWTSRLSRAFAQALPPARARVATRLTRAERARKACELRAQGLSHRDIARVLGVSPATVVNYVKGYPGQRKPQE